MYLLFDIGGSKTRLAVSFNGKTVSKTKIIPTSQDFQPGLEAIKQVADELSGGQKIKAVAGGVAGVLDQDKTMLVTSPHISSWIEQPLKLALEKQFEVPVLLENDANLDGLGEASFGAGVDKSIVAYLTISTGVGGARVVNGKIDENSLGFEPGHQIIVIDGNPCNCGGRGHLETYVAGYYLEKTYQKRAEEIFDPKIWDEIAKYLAIGLNNTIVHWSPDVVVLGGSVMKSISLEAVKVNLKRTLTIFSTPPELVQATLGDQAGLYGALEIIKQNS